MATALAGCSLNVGDWDGASMPERTPPASTATLVFDQASTLELTPGDRRTVSVTASPPARYDISFSVLGDTAGAWLDRSTAVADAGGHASVELHAPSFASTFRLRAAIKDGPAAVLGVAVSDKGFGTLRVMPVYGGRREATGWVASVVAGATCADIASALPGEPAGALVAEAGAEGPVVVPSAPVGPNLAVALRSGKAMWGCADEPDLQAGAILDVDINVEDTPMDLTGTQLDVALTMEPSPELDAMLAASTSRLLDAFLPPTAEAASLLDAMQAALSTTDAPEFAGKRAARGWDSLVATHLRQLPVAPREAVRGFAEVGLARSPLALDGRLTAVGDAPGHAVFEARTLGGVAADDAGVPPAHQVAWGADPGDVLRIGATIFWMPSRYVGAAAEQAVPVTSSMAETLATVVDCDGLGATLAGYAGCDSACMAALCEAALVRRWRAGLDASATAGLAGEMAINASGPAQVDDGAAPIAWAAAWVGSVSDGKSPTVTVHGQGEGVAPHEVGPP